MMKKVGFKFIIYGIESFSNRLLKEMNKSIPSENPNEFSKKIIKNTVDGGIIPLMNIILFYPTTSIADITETIENVLELVDYGSRLTVYSYIEFYAGARIAEDKSMNFIYQEFSINEKKFVLPEFILPTSKEVKELAEKSLKLRTKLMKDILKKYNWEGVVPHPLYGLILFLAIYKILNLKTERIENLIDKIITQESGLTKEVKEVLRC